MKDLKISPEQKEFIKKIIAVDIALLFIAGAIAFSFQQHLGVVLFGLGMLSATIGSYLGNAYPYHPNNPEMSDSNPYDRPVEKSRTRLLYFVKYGVPFYAFENAVLFAGVIAIVGGLLILFFN